MPPVFDPKDFTEEQVQNLMTYGFCWECRVPREKRVTQEQKDGKTTWLMQIVCPNGHPQP